ncbi:MAG TPA: TetR/AcrR family transcriptional regulator [Mycobacterium sp.]|nr:TetR/AcrR family transcriptional regulator [Mycobacterium sp.]
MVIDAALELCNRQCYESVSVDQIAAVAGIGPDDFLRYFDSKPAVFMSLTEDILRAVAASLGQISPHADPEEALLVAHTEVITAIFEGHGIMAPQRLVMMGQVISITPELEERACELRRRVLAAALAEWLGVEPTDRRVQQAVTMWAAVAAGAYTARVNNQPGYESQRDAELPRRMIRWLTNAFTQIIGQSARTGS